MVVLLSHQSNLLFLKDTTAFLGSLMWLDYFFLCSGRGKNLNAKGKAVWPCETISKASVRVPVFPQSA